MARKKKKEPTHVFEVNVSKLSISQEKYIDQMIQFISDNMKVKDVSKDGNKVNFELPESISKKMFKLRLNRFLYQSDLKNDFRLISMLNEGKQGYMIMER
ncbi:hypothetical protein DSAG12_01250 [Promethearchaeum syntrophicum]|uniref:Uncharacterized protein n=1 Tax=Promethearchaeum syntrophicum TaxID=2594042 RepID=A0A5B9D8U8_9ARCH|nr:hypothetical protein [Candidatus Prometheoarchaeum syntrophicum]QEE15425.1 hypothetical protein DSAG12_01250 [Candidatus Prometheoarchaeum syntrophicum]